MRLPSHKTKIIATIGPASLKERTIEAMIKAGMSVARINFAHGDEEQHAKTIELIRKASSRLNRPVAILGDLPGVKIRVGEIAGGSVVLRRWQTITLTTRDVVGNEAVIPIQFKDFPKLVSKGDVIYLSDGFIALRVEKVEGQDVTCKVLVGGTLFSHKGINIPNARMAIDAITERDLGLIEFAIEHGVDAVGISFVGSAYDVLKVRRFIEERNASMFIISKIERPDAVRNFDEILNASDGIMIARGDLGVEMPIEKLPILQKRLIHKANCAGKPVITATQMLESMTEEKLPTRAEVTDVANAILDGTDAVMLSEETAVGKYPVDTVKMMAKIAKTTEAYRESQWTSMMAEMKPGERSGRARRRTIKDAIARSIMEALNSIDVKYILTPTRTGQTARLISRFKPRQWILAFVTDEKVANNLMFSYGVYPFVVSETSEDEILRVIKGLGLVRENDTVLLTKGTPIGKTVGTNTIRIFSV
ncbi:pyruvate kinase [Thermococcus thioreducens]|uniref:Pyruvate kinase n=1 Tax=Thermococcus thioreducens TaxID=277988 RepID=A0A0Q2QQZ6_9EURY|nr:pyruvate kinase [Thermococcus thioreducens]ASJ12590.1 pyruvate kinase [Thermococcus thioreducens]KQH82413.1 pyruvate kinase [Thermococcus thioreducens]SEV88226.1 pyruvate kinase [Thermococcus thioreducens]